MDSNKKWLKFIITGRADDYVSFCDSKRNDNIYGSDNSALYYQRSCDKGIEHRRTGQADNSFDG